MSRTEITAKCPYCGELNTYEVQPNQPVVVTCSCNRGSFYVKKVDRIEVIKNSLWTWKEPAGRTGRDIS